MSAIGEGDLSGGAWASNRFVHLRCIRFIAPKGTRQNDSGAQRMGNYLYFVSAGAVADPEEEGRGGHGSMPLLWGTGQGISPEAPAGDSSWPRKGHSKRAHLAPKGSFLVSRYCIGANSILKSPFYTEREKFLLYVGHFQFQEALLSFRGS